MRAGVDANVILRFLTGDPPDLAAQAQALFDAVDEGRVTLVLEDIVVAEVVWVLRSFYKYPARQIADVLQELLSHEGLESDNKPVLFAALNLFAEKNVGFTDALVAVRMAGKGVGEVFSFDRHFDHLPGITRRTPVDDSG